MKKSSMRLAFGALRAATIGATMAVAVATAVLAEDTVKIGVLLIDSGPLAGLKDTQVKAVNLAIEQINAAGGAAGRKLEATFISYPGTPDTAVDGATRAVQKDGATFITGMDTSAVTPALQAKLPALKALMLEVMANADGLTGKNCSPNYFRVNANDSMIMGTFREFLKDQGIKKWDIIAVDYAAGRDSADKFKALVTSQGGTIGKTLFSPNGTPDFGAKISELGADPADGLFVTIFGSDAINLAKQQQQFGLFKKYKMVLGNSFVIPQTLPAQGEAVLGVYQNIGFVAGFPGAQAEAFVKAYKEKYNGELPPYTSADQYAAIQLIAAGLQKANSTDINAVRAALSGLKAETVLGDVEIRAGDHQTARRMAISQIVMGPEGKPAYQIKKIEPGLDIIPPVDPACKM
ncbi:MULTISPECIES: ABC transporter substrate-binding protein [unclassified Bradyrhizobium]|uniref:ABC transporter substrate-binding protein n=1 Tax=unclassified Bradyrhizobium TaxID=2631580 RepID=UPI002478E7AC|nr:MULTISPECIES: ABC transporter substrate-binding protein [unclassified Bradyrhizobium]WGS17786.1 ABC transporter substrate-binding protein [Bradyrhizobium sp. ISRA463]WGS24582.1 ABC transporter substrate-binding protein [Bradyrhizobium sp. ISRA464]